MEKMRLNKYLAKCGVASRREADRLIEQGAVTVNGRIAGVGDRVWESDDVLVSGKPVKKQEKKVVLAYYKPTGVTCTEKDPHAERVIRDQVRYPMRLTYAGRLDKDSEGLLLLTNDGALIQALMKGANRHEKEYVVRVDREITPDFVERMSGGIYLKELDKTTRPCVVEALSKYTFRIVLTQGLNRQIRRMCEACGYQTRKLKRVRVENITLEGIAYGAYREVTGEELFELYRRAGFETGKPF